MFLRKSQADNIHPIVDFVTRVVVVCVAFCFFCFACLLRVKKSERWSGARENLTRCMWQRGRCYSHSSSRRRDLSVGVTCAQALTRFHFVPWLLFVFLLSDVRFGLVPLVSDGDQCVYSTRAVLPDTRDSSKQT